MKIKDPMEDFNLIDATTGEIIDSDMQFSGGTGTVLIADGNGEMSWEMPKLELESDFKIIMDMIIEKAGLDMKIDEIFEMSENDKKQLIRNLKIDDILE